MTKSIGGVFNISKFIRLMREKRGMRGVRAVASEIGVSHMTYYRIEQCGRIPDLETFIRICKWLEESLDNFIFFNPKKEAIARDNWMGGHR